MFVFYFPNKTNLPELEGKEGDAGALVELGLELHPVKPEGVQERRQTLHQYWGELDLYLRIFNDRPSINTG